MKQPIQDPPQSKTTEPAVAGDFVARRQELAQLIGHLIARYWLKKRQEVDSVADVPTHAVNDST